MSKVKRIISGDVIVFLFSLNNQSRSMQLKRCTQLLCNYERCLYAAPFEVVLCVLPVCLSVCLSVCPVLTRAQKTWKKRLV